MTQDPIKKDTKDAPEETHNEEQAPAGLGGDQVADKLHEEQSKGYSGVVPDPTPNEAYTVAGVTKSAESSDSPKPPTKQEIKDAGI